MGGIYRYDKREVVASSLDPIEDYATWIEGLESTGYVSDILKNVHGFNNSAEISKSAKSVTALTRYALEFLDQAYSGPASVSFLPLYYAILNLSKIYIVLAGRRKEIGEKTRHGANYDVNMKVSQNLLNENVNLWQGGVFPTFYNVLTGSTIQNKRTISLKKIYPFLSSVSHELEKFQGISSKLHLVFVRIVGNPKTGFRVEIEAAVSQNRLEKDIRGYRTFVGLRTSVPRHKAHSPLVNAQSEKEAIGLLDSHLRRSLIYPRIIPSPSQPNPPVFVPYSSNGLLMAEEIPIWLALFHLSSVARYSPEYLARLRDSKSWPLLLALRKHSTLRFLNLFWSYVNKVDFYMKKE